MRRAWAGYLGWSGNPQRLPSLGANGSLACCSPQFFDSQSRSQNPVVHAMSCQYAGYHASGPYLPDARLARIAKMFPTVCKLMMREWRDAEFNAQKMGVVLFAEGHPQHQFYPATL